MTEELDHDLKRASRWQIDLWLWRMRRDNPDTLSASDSRLSWRVFDISEIAPSRLEPWRYDGQTMYCFGVPWRYEGELHEAKGDADGLASLIAGLVSSESSGDPRQTWRLRDRLVVVAPKEVLDSVVNVLQSLNSPASFPESPDDAIWLGKAWALRFPISAFRAPAAYEHADSDDDSERRWWIENHPETIAYEVADALMHAVDRDGWLEMGGNNHASGTFRNEFWVCSDVDIRGEVIEMMNRIRLDGAEAVRARYDEDRP
ncbi:MAG: hypothetical protein H6810_07610 [Phycisphaeraceae bacterium]|nr:MAG: hypothetical protein H6810_07610 [Phycisphaeraceae bacterium]